jgi:hypothetical protein
MNMAYIRQSMSDKTVQAQVPRSGVCPAFLGGLFGRNNLLPQGSSPLQSWRIRTADPAGQLLNIWPSSSAPTAKPTPSPLKLISLRVSLKFVLQKSTPPQICQLTFHHKEWFNRFVCELTFAKWICKHFVWDKSGLFSVHPAVAGVLITFLLHHRSRA